MRKFIIFPLFIFTIISYAQEKPTVMVFFSPYCRFCVALKAEILPPLKAKYRDRVDWLELDIRDPQNLKMLNSLAEQFDRENSRVPAVFIGDTFLMGFNEVKENLDLAIQKSLTKKHKPFSFLGKDLIETFKKFSVFTVIGSGLADGINPCAFAVIIFFMSFLAVYGYRRKEIIYVGIFYCLAVFITYLLIGLGFFQFFYSFEQVSLIIKWFYYFVAFFCFFMGLVALYDYLTFKKRGAPQEAILQLPKFLKRRINIVIGSKFRQKKQRGIGRLIITSLIVGFLVSLLEAACTGQLYVPTIVFILKNTNLRLRAATYLILYNLMFILPLVVIFLLSLMGVSSLKFNNFLKRNVGLIKLIMALVFFALGGFILNI